METKIKIEIKLKDGKKLVLDYDDGVELYNELNRIYGKKTEIVPWPYVEPYPQPWCDRPFYTNSPSTWEAPPFKFQVTCKNSSIQ